MKAVGVSVFLLACCLAIPPGAAGGTCDQLCQMLSQVLASRQTDFMAIRDQDISDGRGLKWSVKVRLPGEDPHPTGEGTCSIVLKSSEHYYRCQFSYGSAPRADALVAAYVAALHTLVPTAEFDETPNEQVSSTVIAHDVMVSMPNSGSPLVTIAEDADTDTNLVTITLHIYNDSFQS